MARLPLVEAEPQEWLAPGVIAEAFRLQPRLVRPDFGSLKWTVVTAVAPGALFLRYIMPRHALCPEAEDLSRSCTVCTVWAACALAAFAVAAFRNPGVVPRARSSGEGKAVMPVAAAVPARYINLNGILVKQRWCHTCRVYRPLRSKHCSYCDRCVFRFDHHCTWLGNCVGLGNYRSFLFLVLTCSLFFGHSALITFQVLIRSQDSKEFSEAWNNGLQQVARKTFAIIAGWRGIAKVAYLLFALAMFLAFVVLLLYHAIIIGCNMTTNEHVRDYYLSGNPFDVSCADNYRQILCTPYGRQLPYSSALARTGAAPEGQRAGGPAVVAAGQV